MRLDLKIDITVDYTVSLDFSRLNLLKKTTHIAFQSGLIKMCLDSIDINDEHLKNNVSLLLQQQ